MLATNKDILTDLIAGVAMTNPVWSEYISKDLNLVIVVLGCIWLLVQIYYKVKLRGKD